VCCEVCGRTFDEVADLATHLIEEAGHSDVAHVMWLNRSITKRQVDVEELTRLIRARAAGGAGNEPRVGR